MDLEVLLTRLEVTPKGELFAGFRNLEGVYFPNWEHKFFTKVLGRKKDTGKQYEKNNSKLVKVIMELGNNPDPRISELTKRKLEEKHWWIEQITCPISLKNKLPEEFIKGHYTKYARWQLSTPGNYIGISTDDFFALEKRKELQKKLMLTLDELEIQREIEDFNENHPGNTRLELFKPRISDKFSRVRAVQSDWNYLKQGRHITGQELANLKWMWLDIEIPFWRRSDAEISWVGVGYLNKDKTEKEIHTLHDLGTKKFKGFDIIRYNTENELMKGLTSSINKRNPDVVSAYNAKFDYMMLRETDQGFKIGIDESNPIYKVTTKFFERVGVKDRFLIDPLRWAKIQRAFDINAKLEMTAGFEKSINYDQLEELEERCFNGDINAARISGSYLCGDIDNLGEKIIKTPEFRKSLEDVCWISKNYGVAFDRLLHSPNCINEAQEKIFFEVLGIPREELPHHKKTKKREKEKRKAKDRVKKHVLGQVLGFKEKKGFTKDVYKCHIPYGDFLKDLVQIRFPDSTPLYEYKKQHRGDKRRLFFLDQYANAFTEWLREDYGFYLRDEKKLDELLKTINVKEFEDIYHIFRETLEKKSKKDLDNLNEGRLGIRATEKYAPQELKDFLNKNGFEYSFFRELANQRSEVKRKGNALIGNYSIYPTVKRFYRKKRGIPAIDEVLEQKANEIKNFIQKNKLQVISQEGNYLYLTGNKEILEKPEAPIILVDEIPRLWNGDNPYYEKYGFYSHMKIKEEPSFHLTMFEMENYKEMLDYLLENKESEARKIYFSGIEKLKQKNIPLKQLLFHNKSQEQYFAYTLTSDDPSGKEFFKKIPKKAKLDIERYLDRFQIKGAEIINLPKPRKQIKNSAQLELIGI